MEPINNAEQIGNTLWQLLLVLGQLVVEVGGLLLTWSLLAAWLVWWLWGANWRKIWPQLAGGGWAPVVLLIVVAALVWASIAPSNCDCLRVVRVPNFWWQLGGVGLLAVIALFCGWLQGLFGWHPAEIEVGPPAYVAPSHPHVEVEVAHAHGHGEAAEPEHPDEPLH